jgi:excisionase family DNA binding protein
MSGHIRTVYERDRPELRLLQPALVASLLGCSRRTVRRMAARGDLRPIRIGPRLVRFSEVEIRALIDPNMNERPAATPGARERAAATASAEE